MKHRNRLAAFLGRGMTLSNPHQPNFQSGAVALTSPLGQYIARAHLQEGIHLTAKHMKKPHEVGEKGWRPFTGVWGTNDLPIAFEAA